MKHEGSAPYLRDLHVTGCYSARKQWSDMCHHSRWLGRRLAISMAMNIMHYIHWLVESEHNQLSSQSLRCWVLGMCYNVMIRWHLWPFSGLQIQETPFVGCSLGPQHKCGEAFVQHYGKTRCLQGLGILDFTQKLVVYEALACSKLHVMRGIVSYEYV